MVPHIKDADVHMINNQEFNSPGQDIIEDPIENSTLKIHGVVHL